MLPSARRSAKQKTKSPESIQLSGPRICENLGSATNAVRLYADTARLPEAWASQQQHMQVCAILKTAPMLSRMPGDVKEGSQARGDRGRLFLLHPVAGAVDELDAFELWTGAFHGFEAAGALIDAPVALARQE